MRALTLTAVAAAAAGLLLTGCGVLGGDTAADEGQEEVSMEEAMIDFAACMRDQGFDMPDPDGEGGMISLPAMDPDDEESLAAMEECEELLPVDENAPSEEEMFEADLRMAECLREHGLDVEDPERGKGLALPIEPGDDEHMAAVSACTEGAGGGGVTVDRGEGDS
ncbi:hypothetical protein DFP74_6309 [Nocardiopsis sp. Huas11]|uniref:hypothetical protein n=1 Tax=Nocardiopsis sp. Huas11 TaxID=2183912 RepID=UPI000EAEE3BE|nr:hypothetical protein [Nocardiopsis sp. Huas11]RKS10536.1 hypothetical protein DFP74_6309 [Nocardiopsis sp. Huas11]